MKQFMVFLSGLVALFGASSSFAVGAMTDIFAAVDLTTVATWVGTIGVLIIGIRMAFKGVDIGGRAVKKA